MEEEEEEQVNGEKQARGGDAGVKEDAENVGTVIKRRIIECMSICPLLYSLPME